MKKFEFSLDTEDDVILAIVVIDDEFEFNAALDTAATHTTFDYANLAVAGVKLDKKVGERFIETSSGIIQVEIYEVSIFEVFGHQIENFQLQVYDFLAHGITPEYDGVLGLDFLQQKDLCIHFSKGYLTFK